MAIGNGDWKSPISSHQLIGDLHQLTVITISFLPELVLSLLFLPVKAFGGSRVGTKGISSGLILLQLKMIFNTKKCMSMCQKHTH